MPNESLKALATPNTGDLPGAWGTAAVNANFQVIGGYLGGAQTISLTGSSATTLSISTGVIGTGSVTPGAGPIQAANAVLKLAGTLSSNVVLTLPCGGYWIVKNSCTVGSFYVQIRAIGTGNMIGAPDGEAVHVWNDGTDCDYANLERVGTYVDMAVTVAPAWLSACTVKPYLPCDSSATYPTSLYPALSARLGSTFGGNGVTTFGLPILSNRVRVSLGSLLTSAACGIDGTVFGASGGAAVMQAHTHTASASDSGHSHRVPVDVYNNDAAGGHVADASGSVTGTQVQTSDTGFAVVTVAIATSGSGSSGNVQPTLVSGITFIRAG